MPLTSRLRSGSHGNFVAFTFFFPNKWCLCCTCQLVGSTAGVGDGQSCLVCRVQRDEGIQDDELEKPNVRTASPVKTQISSVSVLLPSFTSLGDVKPARCTLRAIPSLLWAWTLHISSLLSTSLSALFALNLLPFSSHQSRCLFFYPHIPILSTKVRDL